MSGNRPYPYAYCRDFLGLIKAHLSLYIALSAAAGHALAGGRFDKQSMVTGLWVFLMAAGSGVFNNIQDRRYDRKHKRTRNRLLARRGIPLAWAIILALILTGSAFTGLFFFCPDSLQPLILGLFALICYNGLYTPIKKRSLWAMVPGIICGMIPPAIGWAAVHPVVSTDRSGLMILMTCLGLWQLPHYMLVDLKQPESHLVINSFKRIWQEKGMHHCQVLIWTILFCLAVMLFMVNGWVADHRFFILLLAMVLVLPPLMFFLLFYPGINGASMGFMTLNFAMINLLSIIVMDRLPTPAWM